MRASTIAAAIAASSAIAPSYAVPVQAREEPVEARAGLGAAANVATIGLGGLTALNALGGLFGGGQKRDLTPEQAIALSAMLQGRDVSDMEARAGLGTAANVATIGLGGLTALNALGGLFGGGQKRELTPEQVAAINAAIVNVRDVSDMEARAGLGTAANVATIGLGGLTALNALGGLFGGGQKRDLTPEQTVALAAMLQGRDVSDMEARAGLGTAANVATIGLGGLTALNALGGLFGGGKRELAEDLVARQKGGAAAASGGSSALGTAANVAGIGLAANGILGALFGGNKRELEQIFGRDISEELDLVARQKGGGLATAANVAGIGLAANGILGALFGGNKRDLEELDLVTRQKGGSALGTAANVAGIGLAANGLINALFGRDVAEELAYRSIADLD